MSYSPETTALMQRHWNDVNQLIVSWRNAQAALDEAKRLEIAYRKAVFEVQFPGHTEGTKRVELGGGYWLKAVGKLHYNLINNNGQTAAALSRIATAGPTGNLIATRLVKWSPELSIKEYRILAPEFKTIIDEALEVKPGAPALEIEAPEATK